MCGIVGYSGFSKKILLNEAVDQIGHRGPDAQGIEYFEGTALGNVRLAIIDLSNKGRQPMFNTDKTLCITYNGEIYNYLDIRRSLEKKYKFHSHTDTEVILIAYQEWGVKCLEKLNGMFSFVIYDLKKKQLFGARDRLGQKPLKYYFDGNQFVFGSEIKGILPLLGSKPQIDEIAINDFLTFQYVPSPRTGFKNIYKLPAGCYFIYRNNKLDVHKYWSLDFKEKLDLSENAWKELIYEELSKSVKSHLISDVPIGALLSGGLDSSTVVALMAKHSDNRINTFSIGFDDEKFDESFYADLVSKIYNTKHTKLQVDSKMLIDNISQLAKFYDEPIGDNSILPTLLVSKLASKRVKVALTGDGGDENFGGYDRYFIVWLYNYLYKFSPEIKKITGLLSSTISDVYKHKQTERMNRLLSGLSDDFYELYVNFNCFFINETKYNLYSKEFKKQIRGVDSFQKYKTIYDSKIDNLDNALKIDINTYLPA